ncbi:MAG: aldo/keto reductase, partial [Microbacterium sp.]|nr:aldo/keto reductase [Microbacterium sp.]
MKTIELTGVERPAPNVVLGLMRIQDLDDDAVRTLVGTARYAGIDFFDHADIYGRDVHGCERRFAEAMQLTASEREKITIQTKAGIVREGPYFDFSYDHIVSAVEGSLRALDTDYIDILLLHRPDALVEPDEVARAFDELEAAGKVRAFGVSNHTPRQIDLLKKSVRQPIVANQIQLSITHAPSIAQGVAGNMQGEEQALTLDGGG